MQLHNCKKREYNIEHKSPTSIIPVIAIILKTIFHFADEGDEVVPDGLADGLEKKARTLHGAVHQPLG